MTARKTLARTAVCVAVAGVAATHLTATAAPLEGAAPGASSVEWGECPASWRAAATVDCASFEAPLDYSEPDGEKITVAMGRLAAADQENKIGTLFVNFGGPGYSSIQDLGSYPRNSLNAEVLEKFDVVGVDPRGIGAIEEFECVNNAGVGRITQPIIDTEPGDAAQILRQEASLRYECGKANPKLARFMSTADTARDLDMAREALGEDQLSFYGVSYGTQLAATYVNMFPTKVRAVVADSGIDPVAWSTGHGSDAMTTNAFARVGSVYGAKDALDALRAECARVGADVCGDGGTFDEDWAYIHETMPSQALPQGQFSTYDDFTYYIMSALYSAKVTERIPKVVRLTAQALRASADEQNRAQADIAEITDALDELHSEVRDGGRDMPGLHALGSSVASKDAPWSWLQQRMYGVMCSETANPVDTTQTVATSERLNEVVPGEGRLRTWQGSVCSQWPFVAKNAYYGPYDKETSNGVLVMGNTYDAATPYERGTKVLHDVLPGSRLVTVEDGYGHGAVYRSQCAKDAASEYLISSELPGENVTCRQDRDMFSWNTK